MKWRTLGRDIERWWKRLMEKWRLRRPKSEPEPTPEPAPEPKPPTNTGWRRGLGTLPAVGGTVKFMTRGIKRPTRRNADGGHEWIIARIQGRGIGRVLLMCMSGNRPPSRIYFELSGHDKGFVNSRFPVPLRDGALWEVHASDGPLTVKLDGKEIWRAQGHFTVTEATMDGYNRRGSGGEWRAA